MYCHAKPQRVSAGKQSNKAGTILTASISDKVSCTWPVDPVPAWWLKVARARSLRNPYDPQQRNKCGRIQDRIRATADDVSWLDG